MFTTDNSEFSNDECDTLNEALEIMLADVGDDTRRDAEKSYSDQLNNAWTEGVDVDTLLSRVGHRRT